MKMGHVAWYIGRKSHIQTCIKDIDKCIQKKSVDKSLSHCTHMGKSANTATILVETEHQTKSITELV